MPLVAKVRASDSWSAPRKLTTVEAAASTWGQEEAATPMPYETRGGSRDSEVSEVAVNPTGPRPESAVTTTTPAG